MNKYEEIYAKAVEQTKHPSWIETAITALAVDLHEATGETVEISGPCGLRAEILLYVGTRFIRITPSFPEGKLKLYYDTGEVTNKYPPQSLGDWNGMNNVSEPLPDTLEEIIAVLRPLY